MNAALVAASTAGANDPSPWSSRRLLITTALLFAAQLALIFVLGERGPTPTRPPAAAPVLGLALEHTETLALNDPTLFALPHPQGFAGRAWLQTPVRGVPSRRWVEPPQWLSLDAAALGTAFRELAQAHRPESLRWTVNPLPELAPAAPREPTPAPPSQSALVLADGLAARRLLNPPELPAWPAADLLTNTVVRVLVNGDGVVRSATVLGRSGSAEADQFALNAARAARFEPVAPAAGAPPLQLGAMVFLWSTLPLTNAPAPSP
jgi:TonB family protein